MRYPAVTILFYPPLSLIVEAFFFALFGVSHFVVHSVDGYRIFVRFRSGNTTTGAALDDRCRAAVGVGLTALGLPLVTFWARQVMLDMPAYAFLIWSVYYLLRYLRDEQTWQIVLAVVLLVAGLYVKQTIAFGALGIRGHAGAAIRAVGKSRSGAFGLSRQWQRLLLARIAQPR